MSIKIKKGQKGARLDAFLVSEFSGKTRAYLQKLIVAGDVLVNGKIMKSGYRLSIGDNIEVTFPEPKVIDVKPEKMDLVIIHEDEDIVVIDKPAGMVVHPSDTGGHSTGSLVNGLLYHCGEELTGISGDLRPGIVHRLDKDTSGVMVVAKSDKAQQSLMAQFAERQVKKNYITLVAGEVRPPEARIDSPIGRSLRDRKKMAITSEGSGRAALTEYKVREVFQEDGEKYSLVDVNLKTGRTHQIRVHMNAIGYPVVGDITYGHDSVNKRFEKVFGLRRQFLHAASLTITHPATNKKITFESDLPDELSSVVENLEVFTP